MGKKIEGLWLSKISLQSRVASCHLINLLLLKQLTYPMWRFVVLFTLLRTLSAPQVCAWHHCSVEFLFPALIPLQTDLTEEQLTLNGPGGSEEPGPLWFHSSRGAQSWFLYKPVRRLGHPWDMACPALSLSAAELGAERPSFNQRWSLPAGSSISPWKGFLAQPSVDGEGSHPAHALGCFADKVTLSCDGLHLSLCQRWSLERSGARLEVESSNEVHIWFRHEPAWLKTSWKA